MRKILFAAIVAAVASAANLKSKMVQWSDSKTYGDASPATKWQLDINYDFDISYAIETGIEGANTDATSGLDTILDNWVQASLESEGNVQFLFNLYGFAQFGLNFNVVPFKIIPAWFSLYTTHPYYAIENSSYNLATQMGYELHALEGQVSYFYSFFLPDVSILDYLKDDTTYIVPANPFSSVADITARAADGWDLENDSADDSDWIDDDYLVIDGLSQILDAMSSTFETQKAYFTVDLVGDSSTLTL